MKAKKLLATNGNLFPVGWLRSQKHLATNGNLFPVGWLRSQTHLATNGNLFPVGWQRQKTPRHQRESVLCRLAEVKEKKNPATTSINEGFKKKVKRRTPSISTLVKTTKDCDKLTV
jgi:hypothetical protein